MASKESIADAVRRLFTAAACYYDPGTCQTYFDALTDVPDEDLKPAVELLLRTERWEDHRKPSPALVRSHVRRLQEARSARAGPTAVEDRKEQVTPRAEYPAKIAMVRPSRLGRPRGAAVALDFNHADSSKITNVTTNGAP